MGAPSLAKYSGMAFDVSHGAAIRRRRRVTPARMEFEDRALFGRVQKRNPGGRGYRVNAGQHPQRVAHLPKPARVTGDELVAGGGRHDVARHRRDEHTVGADTRVDPTEVQQRPHRQSRADQQRDRECDLHHHQLPAQSG
jgi:hypothetical protein